MTIHPDLTAALKDHGGNLQDAIREVWIKSIPPHLRKGTRNTVIAKARPGQDMRALAAKGADAMRRKALEFRTLHAPQVLALFEQGKSLTAIAESIGIGRYAVAKIVADPQAHTPRPDLHKVLERAASNAGLTLLDLIRHDRRAHVSKARRRAVLAARQCGYGLSEIGLVLERDHKTILSAEKQARRDAA